MSNQGHQRAADYLRERRDAEWEAGFQHAKRGGKLRNNPHNGVEQPDLWRSWTDGYRYGKAVERTQP